MRTLTSIGILVVLFCLGTAMAAPIPLSAVGTYKSISIISHPYDLSGGGRFTGTVSGYLTDLWCVDTQNSIGIPSSYKGDVTLLGAWPSGQDSTVQKGTVTSWGDGQSYTALFRYQAAAYLLSEMTGVASHDQPLQDAIWRVLFATGWGGSMPASNPDYTAAISYITAHPDYGFGQWAVVSGSALPGGALDDCDRHQTFMVQVQNPIPEPGTYTMLGAGLLGLAFLNRRKRTS